MATLKEFEANRAKNKKQGDFYVSIVDGECLSDRMPGPVDDSDKARAEFLFNLLDDIDTLGDVAKSDDAGYREAVEKIQARRWESGIRTDGYKLYHPGESMPKDNSVPQQAVKG